jgi:hypothetical protein
VGFALQCSGAGGGSAAGEAAGGEAVEEGGIPVGAGASLLALKGHLLLHFPEEACSPQWERFVRAWAGGHRDSSNATRVFRRALCLYHLSSAPPLKPLIMFSLAGRPDYGIQAALEALGHRAAQQEGLGLGSGSLSASLFSHTLSPADRNRLAHAAFTAQMMVQQHSSAAAAPVATALSPQAFRAWLAASKDYTPHYTELALARCVKQGAFCEAVTLGLARGCMPSVLRACMGAEGSARALAQDVEALRLLGESGWGARFLAAETASAGVVSAAPGGEFSDEEEEEEEGAVARGTSPPPTLAAPATTDFPPKAFALLVPLDGLAACALCCHHAYQTGEDDAQCAYRHAPRGGHLGIGGGEQQRSVRDRQHGHNCDGHRDQKCQA